MTFKEKFESEEDWQHKIMIMDMYHCRMLLRKGSRNWRMIDTANYFGKSLSLVSENITIAELIRSGRWKGNGIDSRNKALKYLKELNENGKSGE